MAYALQIGSIGESPDQLRCPVRGTVVDDDQFEILICLRQDALDRLADVSFAVQDRHSDADPGFVTNRVDHVSSRPTRTRLRRSLCRPPSTNWIFTGILKGSSRTAQKRLMACRASA